MTTLFLDLETYGHVPIKNGAHRYAEDAEVLLVALANDDAPVEVWDTQDRPNWRAELQARIDRATKIVIHNSAFDRTVLRHRCVNVPVEKITDTMVIALQHSLPGSLGQLCDILGVPTDKAKDKDGKKLINLFTKARPKNTKLRRATRETHPDEWQRFVEYARLDVDAMRSVLGRLPTWNCSVSERDLWQLDQRVNDLGVAVDVALAQSALRAFERTTRSLAARAGNLTGGAVASATQRAAVLKHLREAHGIDSADLTKATVETLLRGDMDDDARELLEIRQQAAATSPAKYKALLGAVSSDGRLRGTIQFCGAARTGRDAGRIFQPQNLPRTPDWFDGDVQEITIAAFKADAEDLIWDNVSDRCAMSVRGALLASTAMKLVIADLSNIEGRVLAWLAGEQWKIEAFKLYDQGKGPDLYKVTAGRILGKDPADITKTERQNQGKVPELAGGFQGGVGAYRKMGGETFNAMDDDAINDIVQAWRKAHPRTKALWYDIESAAKAAIRTPGDSFDVRGLLTFDVREDQCGRPWLRIRLPSGRYLCYLRPRIDGEGPCGQCGGKGTVLVGGFAEDNEMAHLEVCRPCYGSGQLTGSGQILYEGMNQYTRKWSMLETYGGKLCIAGGTPVLTDAGWLPIEHVTTSHKVWDGVEWVGNEGLAEKGVKGVVCLNGVWMTPDHEVLTTKGWVCASQSEGLERADPRIPDGYGLPRQRRTSVTVGATLRVRQRGNDASSGDREAAKTQGLGLVRLHAPGEHSGAQDDARDVGPQGLCGVAQHAGPLRPADASGLAQLRRTGHLCLQGVARLVRGLLGRHGANVPGGADVGAPRQFRRIQPGELRVGYTQAAGAEQEAERADQHAVGPDHGGRGGGSVGAEPHHPVLSGEQRRAGASAVRGTGHIAEVYDLVNCGPRRRFVVAGETGEAFLVHNCENVVQAIARDVFLHGMRKAILSGYEVVLRVHDELVCEVPANDNYTHETLADIMSTNPSWATGLPLSAAGFESLRYRKE